MTTATNPLLKTLSISNPRFTSIPSIFNPKSLVFSISSKLNELPLSVSVASTQRSSFSLQKPTLSSRVISCVAQTSDWEQEAPSAVLDEEDSDTEGPNAYDFGFGDAEGEVSAVGPEDNGEGFPDPPEDARLFVGNLPFDVDSEKLAQIFDGAGVVEVAEVIYSRDTGRSRGFGFVAMSTIQEAEKAVEMFNNYLSSISEIVKEIAPQVMSEYEVLCSAIAFRLYIVERPLWFIWRGSGICTAAAAFLAYLRSCVTGMMEMEELNGRILTVNIAAPRGSRAERPPREFQPSFQIYVGNLPWDVDGTRLKQVFSEHGKVLSARVVSDRDTGRSRGFGFVAMASEAEMNDAISALNGQIDESKGVVEPRGSQAWVLKLGSVKEATDLGSAGSLLSFKRLRSGLMLGGRALRVNAAGERPGPRF
ncbi:hypothetical protein Cgig2_015720 [Carnegiea gigantea]|uniref:RRM domain-containing protein n=1 Tax=Carnegiea gigantea TaxID=171969 RepID=A0A9Q1JQX1_9CARY|nr:hypothetical protein Cgig2_015720 [Carnegiea gigantea]